MDPEELLHAMVESGELGELGLELDGQPGGLTIVPAGAELRRMEPVGWEYTGKLVHVVDGDTVDLRVSRPVDFGFRMRHELSAVVRFRLVGIDTPELVGPMRAAAQMAADFLGHLLREAERIRVVSLGEPDKYGGRWDARIYLEGERPDRWIEVGPYLVLLGYAQAYDGKGPRPTWDPAAAYPLHQ